MAGESELKHQDHLQERRVGVDAPFGELGRPEGGRVDFVGLELLDDNVGLDLEGEMGGPEVLERNRGVCLELDDGDGRSRDRFLAEHKGLFRQFP